MKINNSLKLFYVMILFSEVSMAKINTINSQLDSALNCMKISAPREYVDYSRDTCQAVIIDNTYPGSMSKINFQETEMTYTKRQKICSNIVLINYSILDLKRLGVLHNSTLSDNKLKVGMDKTKLSLEENFEDFVKSKNKHIFE